MTHSYSGQSQPSGPLYSPRIFNTAIAVTLGILVSVLRPTAFGEVFSFPFAAAILFFSVFLFLLSTDRIDKAAFSRISLGLVLFTMTVLYVAARNILSGGAGTDNAVKFSMISLAGILAVAACSCDRNSQRALFDTLAIMVAFSCCSVVVTFLLISIGVRAPSLEVAHFTYTYVGRGTVLFPFTFSFNEVRGWFGPVPRLSGLFREPGILPAFACWAATYAYLRRWPMVISVLCIAGSAACMSSLGLPLAMFTGVLLLLNKAGIRIPVALVIILGVMILAWPILYGIRDAGVGLGGKIASNSISFRERMYLLEIAFSSSNPIFGDGTSSLYRLNEGISLISQIRIYGFIYFVLVLSIYLLATRNFTLFLIGLFPAIITALVSQPIAVDVPFVLMFMSYAALDRNAWAVDTRARPEVIGNIASTADRV